MKLIDSSSIKTVASKPKRDTIDIVLTITGTVDIAQLEDIVGGQAKAGSNQERLIDCFKRDEYSYHYLITEDVLEDVEWEIETPDLNRTSESSMDPPTASNGKVPSATQAKKNLTKIEKELSTK